jgi:two-component system LytT family response regulator
MITDQKIILSCQNSAHIINPDDIMYCKSADGYTCVYLADGEQLLLTKSLTRFASEVNFPVFLRISQSYLINVNYLSFIDKRKKFVKMKNQVEIPFTVTIKALLGNISGSKG